MKDDDDVSNLIQLLEPYAEFWGVATALSGNVCHTHTLHLIAASDVNGPRQIYTKNFIMQPFGNLDWLFKGYC